MPAEGSMKSRLLSFLIILFLINGLCFVGCTKEAKKAAAAQEVTVYAYDSFTADWGPGPLVCEGFEKATGIKVNMISVGDGAQVLSRALLEKNAPQADVLIGIDNQLADKALAAGITAAYKPAGADKLEAATIYNNSWDLVPYDWSNFSMIFDSDWDVPAPASLSDLTNPVFEKKIILMDPRTSTPGLGFVMWTLAEFGMDGLADFWTALKPNILTMAPGWDAGYGFFTSGEAPLVISYTTSAAYHVYDGIPDRYVALEFAEGHPMQAEYAALVKGAKNESAAKTFIDYLVSDEAQGFLPETQWMYPSNTNTVMPECYATTPVPQKTILLTSDQTALLDQAVATVLEVLSK